MVREEERISEEKTPFTARDCETLEEIIVYELPPDTEQRAHVFLIPHHREPELGARYEHYKRKEHYTVLGVGVQIPDGELVIVYRGEYEALEFGKDHRWVRRLSSFLENVTQEGMPVARFRKLSIP